MKVRRLKIIFLSMGVIFVIAIFPVLFVIMPINKNHGDINRKESLLWEAEKKSDALSEAAIKSSDNIRFLQEKLRENSRLSFFEDALNASRLLIESIKPNQGRGHDEIHLAIKGEYRMLIHFVALLSQQPNSIELARLLVEKNRIEVILKDNVEKPVVTKINRHSNILKRVDFALATIEIPAFSFKPRFVLKEVQSPFVPRVFPKNKNGPFQSLENVEWHLSGEVRKENVLLGIFLTARNQSQSRYFGIGLPWENSDWSVINITQSAIVFEESKNRAHWRLSYSLFQ